MSGGLKLGDVIELGRHRLMCGDTFNPEHVDALMQGDKPDMLYCDPPYGMSSYLQEKRTSRPAVGMVKTQSPVTRCPSRSVNGDEQDFNPQNLIERFGPCEQFWWGADYYAERLPHRNSGSWIMWDKRLTESMDRGFGSCFEMCWSRKRHKRDIVRVQWAGIFGLSSEPERKRMHPTQKPVALAEWFLDRYSKDGSTVVDLFGGSGSTLLACERKGRICRMMELSPQYCQVIVDRYHALTQQQPLALEAVS